MGGADEVPSPISIAEHPASRPINIVMVNIRIATGIGIGNRHQPKGQLYSSNLHKVILMPTATIMATPPNLHPWLNDNILNPSKNKNIPGGK
jgi:hypothetical protein